MRPLSSFNQPPLEREENPRNITPAFQRSCDTSWSRSRRGARRRVGRRKLRAQTAGARTKVRAWGHRPPPPSCRPSPDKKPKPTKKAPKETMQAARAALAGLPACWHEPRGPLAYGGQRGRRDVTKAIGGDGGRISAIAASGLQLPGKQMGGNQTGSGTSVEVF